MYVYIYVQEKMSMGRRIKYVVSARKDVYSDAWSMCVCAREDVSSVKWSMCVSAREDVSSIAGSMYDAQEKMSLV